MTELLSLLLAAVLISYFGLTRIPVLRPFAGLTDPFEGAFALAIATGFVLLATVPLSYVWEQVVLEPLGLQHLRTLALILIVMAAVQGVEIGIRRHGRWLPERPGFFVLLSMNPVVVGLALLNDARRQGFFDAVLFTVLAGAGYAGLLLTFTNLNERLRHAPVPAVFRDAPLGLVTAGIMALGFMGLSGLIRE